MSPMASLLNHSIEGTLYINEQYICDTVENRYTALPAGTYRIVRHYCKQYDRMMPMIIPAPFTLNHPPCSQCKLEDLVFNNRNHPQKCPMLKPGNGAHTLTDGSILLGTSLCSGCLKHPLAAFNPLAERIRKASKRHKTITLTITT